MLKNSKTRGLFPKAPRPLEEHRGNGDGLCLIRAMVRRMVICALSLRMIGSSELYGVVWYSFQCVCVCVWGEDGARAD